MPRYASLIYNGYWWSPERRALQVLIDHTQQNGEWLGARQAVQGQRHRRRPRFEDRFAVRSTIATFEDDAAPTTRRTRRASSSSTPCACASPPTSTRRRGSKRRPHRAAVAESHRHVRDQQEEQVVVRRQILRHLGVAGFMLFMLFHHRRLVTSRRRGNAAPSCCSSSCPSACWVSSPRLSSKNVGNLKMSQFRKCQRGQTGQRLFRRQVRQPHRPVRRRHQEERRRDPAGSGAGPSTPACRKSWKASPAAAVRLKGRRASGRPTAGQSFSVAGNSSFDIEVSEALPLRLPFRLIPPRRACNHREKESACLRSIFSSEVDMVAIKECHRRRGQEDHRPPRLQGHLGPRRAQREGQVADHPCRFRLPAQSGQGHPVPRTGEEGAGLRQAPRPADRAEGLRRQGQAGPEDQDRHRVRAGQEDRQDRQDSKLKGAGQHPGRHCARLRRQARRAAGETIALVKKACPTSRSSTATSATDRAARSK